MPFWCCILPGCRFPIRRLFVGEVIIIASPQKENGFIGIANDLYEELTKVPLLGAELQVVLFVIRKTYGFNKIEDEISLTQFEKATCKSRPTIVKALKKLQLVNILQLVKTGDSKKSSNIYKLNKDFDTWKLVNTSELVKQNGSTSKANASQLVKTGKHTKDNTKDNTKDILCRVNIPYKEIIEYLNEKTGKKFNYRTKETQLKIKARWNNNWTFDDFKTVIDNKCAQWLTDDKMISFLRPETLFGTKFESYLNEIINESAREGLW